MTPDTLRKELVRSMKRRGMEPPAKPYKKDKPLHVRDAADTPGYMRGYGSRRPATCKDCGREFMSKAMDVEEATCKACGRVATPELAAAIQAIKDERPDLSFNRIARELGVAETTAQSAYRKYG